MLRPEPSPDAPRAVLIAGGGRWARTLAGIVMDWVPRRTRVLLLSPTGASDLRRWADARGVAPRVDILTEPPAGNPDGPAAVLVANAARRHYPVALWSLDYAQAVLVEKPVALTRMQVERLRHEADRRGCLLAASQVLRFCHYLSAFVSDQARLGEVQSARLEWWDPITECRHGELKTFDTSIPVFVDVLPHVLTVLEAVFGQRPRGGTLLAVRRGGAEVALRLWLDSFPCNVVLARNAPERRRRLVVTRGETQSSLDWTVEPGTIRDDAGQRCADETWSERPTPLTQMLTGFLGTPSAARADPRFGMDSALAAASLIDHLYPLYADTLVQTLAEGTAAWDGLDPAPEPLRYGLRELVQSDCSVSRNDAPAAAGRLLVTCRGMDRQGVLAQLRRQTAASLDCGQWPKG